MTACPSLMTSAAGSSSIDDCFCEPGYNETSDLVCELCPVYDSTSDSCTSCPVGHCCDGQFDLEGVNILSLSNSYCPDAGENYNGVCAHESGCNCTDGFYKESEECVVCPENFFCTNDVKTACTVCDNAAGLFHTKYCTESSDAECDSCTGSSYFFRSRDSIVSGESHTCVKMLSGKLKCWGSNANGRLGISHPLYDESVGTFFFFVFFVYTL